MLNEYEITHCISVTYACLAVIHIGLDQAMILYPPDKQLGCLKFILL